VLDRLLGKLHKAGHRVVIFSQYRRTLDIIDDYLHLSEYRYVRMVREDCDGVLAPITTILSSLLSLSLLLTGWGDESSPAQGEY